MRSGYAGEGFFSPGHRLGAGISYDLPPYLARLKALEAAEERRRANDVLGGGGRLGGLRITALQGMDPRELAAQVLLCVFRLLKIYVNTTFRRLPSAESVMRPSVGRVYLPSAKPRGRPGKASKTSLILRTIPLWNRGLVLCAHFTMSRLCCSAQHALLSVLSTRVEIRVNHVLLSDHRGHRVLPDQFLMPQNSLESLQ